MQLEGVYTAMVTPFDHKGAVDLEALERLIAFQIDHGVAGLVPCGSTGEFYALSTAEHVAVLQCVAERAAGRVGLIAGSNAGSTHEVITLVQRAREYGYDAALLAPPYYSLPATDELVAHYTAVHEATDLPLLLYNFPARAGVPLSLEVLEGLRPLERIIGIKESSGDMARLYQLLVRFGDRYQIVCGADDQALDYFLWGARAWIAGSANCLPAEHVALYRTALQDGDFRCGRERMGQLLPLFLHLEAGKYTQKVKLGCELVGIPVGEPRPPLQALDAEARANFARLFEQARG